MKLWILATGLIAIVPLSNGMLWLNPPPVVEEAPAGAEVGYDLAQIAALNKLAARKPTQSDRAAMVREKQLESAKQERERCQDDFVCLIAWAERRDSSRERP